MSDIAIRVENLSKQYRIGGPQARYKTIRESLTEAVQVPFRRLASVVRGQSSAVSNETLWALKDISFEACPELSRRVQRGEVVGIPSTTLTATPATRVLSQWSPATSTRGGRTGIGRNGAGKTTLRENITLNGAIPSTSSPPRLPRVLAVEYSRWQDRPGDEAGRD